MTTVWNLLTLYVSDFEMANQCRFGSEAWGRVMRLHDQIEESVQERLEAENQQLRQQLAEANIGLRVLNELRVIEDRIPWDDPAKLPGTPKLTDSINAVVMRYFGQKQQLAETEAVALDWAKRNSQYIKENSKLHAERDALKAALEWYAYAPLFEREMDRGVRAEKALAAASQSATDEKGEEQP